MNFNARHSSPHEPVRPHRRTIGWVTPTLVALLCAGLLAASYNHKRGNFHKLRTAVLPTEQQPLAETGPGGQPPVRLARSVTSLGSYPEFVSVTMLPGRGMQLLQITANLPNRGEVQLLQAPSLEDATHALTNTGDDADGRLSATFGAALLAPWAGHLYGTPSGNQTLEATWQGHRIPVPAETGSASIEGLLFDKTASNVTTGIVADGQSATGIVHLTPTTTHWPGSLDITSSIQLAGRAIDLNVTAHNVGATAVPVGLGWKPFFRIVSGDRADATLYLPSSTRELTDARDGRPTGHTANVTDTEPNFEHAEGTPLIHTSLDATYTDFHTAAMADGPSIELRDPAADYGLRLTFLSDNINTLHVVAPAGKPWIALESATNHNDPFGREWNNNGSGITVLAPGATLNYHVRLEIFPVTGGNTTNLNP